MTREIVSLSLEPGSLDELLAGPVCIRVLLFQDADDPAGTYRLAALVPTDDSGIALLRVIAREDPDGAPPLPEPTEAVAEQEHRWRTHLEKLP